MKFCVYIRREIEEEFSKQLEPGREELACAQTEQGPLQWDGTTIMLAVKVAQFEGIYASIILN